MLSTLVSGAQFDGNGVIYAPSNNIVQSGSSWTQSACTELVAKNIQFNNGTGSLPRTGCSNYNYPTPSLSSGTTGVSLRE